MLSAHVFCVSGMYLLTAYPIHWGVEGKKRFTHYSVKKYRVHTLKWPLFFWRHFRQSRPSNYLFLGSKFTEKTQIKSMADHVRFNPFYWAFETLAPRLLAVSQFLGRILRRLHSKDASTPIASQRRAKCCPNSKGPSNAAYECSLLFPDLKDASAVSFTAQRIPRSFTAQRIPPKIHCAFNQWRWRRMAI